MGVLKLAHDYNIFQKRAVGTQNKKIEKPLGVLRWSGNIFVSPKVSCGQQNREKKVYRQLVESRCPKEKTFAFLFFRY